MENNENMYDELLNSFNNAFIDNSINGFNDKFSPSLLFNDPKNKIKIINTLIENLEGCDEFFIAVAFITQSGLQLFKNVFKELKSRNVKGKILTTDYLSFTEPKALKEIRDNYPNIEVRLYKTNGKSDGFHVKAYIISKNKLNRLIIGSSNMTDKALTINKEWNTSLVSTKNGSFIKEIKEQYNTLFKSATPLNDYIDTYEEIYNKQKINNNLLKEHNLVPTILEPNSMQIKFCNRLKEMINNNEHKGLFISSTGTGKTFASAFGLKEINPKKVLFLSHRTQILIQNIISYKKVLFEKKITLISGDKKAKNSLLNDNLIIENIDEADIIFATIESFSKEEIYKNFNKDYFDFIIIDEVHRAGSDSYIKIIDYFKPNFILGMTATPERTDDASKIYELFDHNIVLEIRLQDALEENLLCPFHYYGITDIKGINDSTYKNKDFNLLYSDERIDYIIKQSKYYGYSGNRLKGLIFTSTKEDGKELEIKLNERGYKTKFLSGEDNNDTRILTIEKLVSDNNKDYLDFIITVDIFNEGVDIPEVNQIILLRPTISSIIFIQQLGRGLRKRKNKDYVVILDFIGNYSNNFMIPKAFSYNGDKEMARMVVTNGFLPGISTIEFDEIAKEKIFHSIQKANFNSKDELIKVTLNLINKLDRIPTPQDFNEYTDFDYTRFMITYNSYCEFLNENEKHFPKKYNFNKFNEEELALLKFISKGLGMGIRVEEVLLVKFLIEGKTFLDFKLYLKEKYKKEINSFKLITIKNVLSGKFDQDNQFKLINDDFSLDNHVLNLLNNDSLKREILNILRFFITRYENNYFDTYKDLDLCLNKLYSYKDVCLLLNYQKSLHSVIGGYKYEKDLNIFPIFINYDKSFNVNLGTDYADYFINEQIIHWESKKNRTLKSKELEPLFNKDNPPEIYLFVRKVNSDKDAKKFFFLGSMKPISKPIQKIKEFKENNKTIKYSYVDLEFKLDVPVRKDIYNYLISNIKDEDDENC